MGNITRLHDLPARIIYYRNGKVKEMIGLIMRRSTEWGLPAYIEYYETGVIKMETFYEEGKFRGGNEPIWVEYDENGKMSWWEFAGMSLQ